MASYAQHSPALASPGLAHRCKSRVRTMPGIGQRGRPGELAATMPSLAHAGRCAASEQARRSHMLSQHRSAAAGCRPARLPARHAAERSVAPPAAAAFAAHPCKHRDSPVRQPCMSPAAQAAARDAHSRSRPGRQSPASRASTVHSSHAKVAHPRACTSLCVCPASSCQVSMSSTVSLAATAPARARLPLSGRSVHQALDMRWSADSPVPAAAHAASALASPAARQTTLPAGLSSSQTCLSSTFHGRICGGEHVPRGSGLVGIKRRTCVAQAHVDLQAGRSAMQQQPGGPHAALHLAVAEAVAKVVQHWHLHRWRISMHSERGASLGLSSGPLQHSCSQGQRALSSSTSGRADGPDHARLAVCAMRSRSRPRSSTGWLPQNTGSICYDGARRAPAGTCASCPATCAWPCRTWQSAGCSSGRAS